jgi:hypothetical protein
MPKMDVVVMLASIVEEGRIFAMGADHDFFERLALEFGALDQIIAVVHVSKVMLVVVIFQRFLDI